MEWQPHLTVAAVVERAGRFLLVEERAHGETVYNQPAGHVDPNETLIEAVVRETQEETAWRFTPEAMLGVYLWHHQGIDETFLRVAFIGSVDNHQPEQALDCGIERCLWLTLDEIKESAKARSPLVTRCIEDYDGGQRISLAAVPDVLNLL